jgi:hypothetical protein
MEQLNLTREWDKKYGLLAID